MKKLSTLLLCLVALCGCDDDDNSSTAGDVAFGRSCCTGFDNDADDEPCAYGTCADGLTCYTIPGGPYTEVGVCTVACGETPPDCPDCPTSELECYGGTSEQVFTCGSFYDGTCGQYLSCIEIDGEGYCVGPKSASTSTGVALGLGCCTDDATDCGLGTCAEDLVCHVVTGGPYEDRGICSKTCTDPETDCACQGDDCPQGDPICAQGECMWRCDTNTENTCADGLLCLTTPDGDLCMPSGAN